MNKWTEQTKEICNRLVRSIVIRKLLLSKMEPSNWLGGTMFSVQQKRDISNKERNSGG